MGCVNSVLPENRTFRHVRPSLCIPTGATARRLPPPQWWHLAAVASPKGVALLARQLRELAGVRDVLYPAVVGPQILYPAVVGPHKPSERPNPPSRAAFLAPSRPPLDQERDGQFPNAQVPLSRTLRASIPSRQASCCRPRQQFADTKRRQLVDRRSRRSRRTRRRIATACGC